MPIFAFQADGYAIHRCVQEPAIAEIQEYGLKRLQVEAKFFFTRSCVRFRDQRKCQAIPNIGNLCGTLSRQFSRNTPRRLRETRKHGGEDDE